ncbi:MAG: hypothetical protein A3E02_01005 [Candidatus Zambryskibacteria bacterium RIFCSPHIGHO2_12_FULL_38_34]|uniref:Glycosyltransferase RgtA/B/C/D-like domain-containing protein n=1 Tax=Candidatus Zambryskibacteria bacterium RIFCSPLOWO2_12_FULL_39_16 TaxID=1802775 RepID=A0A1G2USK2_9BACT|nr:MAG: hypothetical protein A3D37_01860 [Candidatus Zambryskibacteria bacterium RIFCSPHIGHO2_02_FULL_38_22]OHA98039.1 MAG: hypothetical protein A3E02_01005 [Candidatus Zambryskibacteria bacterium RIFCSPHIGHO2_12_FULL_38_34]OHB07932.1 MAG: hypothetical protein A3I19_00315 [Candidatus Zambryskibacteria bacterium RIFCSPLOWO2_02_FULL_38_13]OHB12336.1 MAG: hypothetical protein A3G46_02020 [Candidatus Zambryskibacteria bacterium RIFCSPLOWO2_12_FULL_39_16]
MNSFTFKNRYLDVPKRVISYFSPEVWVVILSIIFAVGATTYYYLHGYIIAYGDAESHLNIAKRVVDSLTPGFAQLGGIWLPLPHIFLIPFVYFDFLWKTGLAGSIVSGIAFIISALYIYKLALLLTRHRGASFFASLIFIFNPNILYLQSTPMTEMTLIVFFILSSYYFILFLRNDKKIINLLFAAFFGFCASLSRYDGWALVLMEAGVLFLFYFPYRFKFEAFIEKFLDDDSSDQIQILERKERISGPLSWSRLEGRLIMFCTLAFFGIILWLAWDGLILGDPLYFSHSQFSANSQQQGWLARGELPAYYNIFTSLIYYFVTSAETVGFLVASIAMVGIASFLINKENRYRILILLIAFVPFFFNVITLFLGQSVIFLPGVTPITFDWTLFNVRYGVMMLPVFALFSGYIFYRSGTLGKALVSSLLVLQCLLFFMGFSSVLALEDGRAGLSSFIAKIPDAQGWLEENYDGGLLLTDDYARTISIVRLPIKMQDVIYIGNKPYWEESLIEPEKYAKWIVMQKNDSIWKNLIDDELKQGRLYKYFNKAYTSEDILIFKRIADN